MKGLQMAFFIISLLAALGGFFAYVRLAPSDAARWHIDPGNTAAWRQERAWREVVVLTGGAILRLPADEGLLARLDAIAVATPRITRLAGSVGAGRITWIARSGFWGFPDYITAQAREDGVYLYSRQRFGKSDFGVNAARLKDWLSKL
jgi:hypothetical protein